MGDPAVTVAFIRTFAHDLDNVLAGIRGALEIVTSGATDGTRADFARAALSDLGRAEALIQNAATYAAPPSLVVREVDAAHLIREATSRVRPSAQARGVDVQVGPIAEGALHADADQLARAITELLQNAVDAGAAGTKVHVRSCMTQSEFLVEIDDEGAERPDARAFEPFFSTKWGHVGLGLSIAKQIAGAHRGSIELDVAEGGGTRARLRVPRHNPTAPAGPSAPRRP